ncbi:sialate O-acetylesterase [Planctomycetota bacterium]
MKITAGFFNHCVLQRNRAGLSDALVTLKDAAAGVKITVKKGQRNLKSISIQPVPGKRNEFRIKGIPSGGPYTVILKTEVDTLTVKDILVGDVWLLGGQSNMQGVGLLKDRAPSGPEVRAYYMDDRWAVARDPIHNMFAAKAGVHPALNDGVPHTRDAYAGVGPGVSFGQEMRRLTGVPQGLIACGHGGTSMAQWDPKLKKEGDLSLYGATINRFQRNGCRVKGLVWYQGESDANQESVDQYSQRMQKLIAAFRRDTVAGLPVAMVQIGRVLNWGLQGGEDWNRIQEQQRLLPQKIKRLTVVPAINLELDDSIHISGKDQQVLGRNLARAMGRMLRVSGAGRAPIELGKISTELSRNDRSRIVVAFSNCEGRLTAGGRPHGFCLSDGLPSDEIVKVELKGSKAVIESVLPKTDLDELSIAYGMGGNPYCNITDEAGRSLPAFGPIALGLPRARTAYIQALRISQPRPAQNIKALKCPTNPKSLDMQGRLFETTFCDIREHAGPGDKLLYLACRFKCDEPMRLRMMFGYDGPFKAWCDGKKIFCDPKGTNPALPTDKGTADLKLKAGIHEMLMALGTNKGAAWGIYFRMERLDVTKRQLKAGREAYALPCILG